MQDPEHGSGQFTEKRIYISSKLPSWLKSMVPKIFYVTEKAWNYYPFTVTEYSVGLGDIFFLETLFLSSIFLVFFHPPLCCEHPY
jgi:hypothetical protein